MVSSDHKPNINLAPHISLIECYLFFSASLNLGYILLVSRLKIGCVQGLNGLRIAEMKVPHESKWGHISKLENVKGRFPHLGLEQERVVGPLLHYFRLA